MLRFVCRINCKSIRWTCVRVTRVARDESCELITPAGNVTAGAVVLATGLPFLDRGLYFAKVTAHRSYALAFRGAMQIPRGMYELMVPGMRWNVRGSAYGYFMVDRYPPWVWG